MYFEDRTENVFTHIAEDLTNNLNFTIVSVELGSNQSVFIETETMCVRNVGKFGWWHLQKSVVWKGEWSSLKSNSYLIGIPYLIEYLKHSTDKWTI